MVLVDLRCFSFESLLKCIRSLAEICGVIYGRTRISPECGGKRSPHVYPYDVRTFAPNVINSLFHYLTKCQI